MNGLSGTAQSRDPASAAAEVKSRHSDQFGIVLPDAEHGPFLVFSPISWAFLNFIGDTKVPSVRSQNQDLDPKFPRKFPRKHQFKRPLPHLSSTRWKKERATVAYTEISFKRQRALMSLPHNRRGIFRAKIGKTSAVLMSTFLAKTFYIFIFSFLIKVKKKSGQVGRNAANARVARVSGCPLFKKSGHLPTFSGQKSL